MTERQDLAYFIGREANAREQATAARDISVRLAHVAAADGYAVRIGQLRAALVTGH